MEQHDLFYEKGQFIETQTGNKVSLQSVLCGSQNIILQGKTITHADSIIRGDLANVRIGRQCIIGPRSVIRPPPKQFPNKTPSFTFLPITIGDFVTIEEGCVISAAQIGQHVHIGKNCIIGRRCILKDCCKIEDNTVLPPDTVVPPFTVYGGSPGRMLGELPECTKDIHRDLAKNYYAHFLPRAAAPAGK
eukprot:m.50435 g.50435  ORF g.50435 m.50435 type:complete len:190 (+) comp12905_c0_seq3:43-612(+)